MRRIGWIIFFAVLILSACTQKKDVEFVDETIQEEVVETEEIYEPDPVLEKEEESVYEKEVFKENEMTPKSETQVFAANYILLKTNVGDIELELYPDKAPITVENFVKYANDGFFVGLVFHRIIDGFMIQGGGFDQTPQQKNPTYGAIQNEADNGLSNEIGTIAMARTNAPHSATSQFFININNNTFLDHTDKGRGWGYCVFGKVTKGMDVVNSIKSVRTHTHPKMRMQDWPIEPVIIERVEVSENAIS